MTPFGLEVSVAEDGGSPGSELRRSGGIIASSSSSSMGDKEGGLFSLYVLAMDWPYWRESLGGL